MAITLKPEERDAIFTQVSADFTLFGDLERAIEEECYRLGRILSDGLRLLLDGVLEDSPDEPRRVRLLNPAGEETARLSGVLAVKSGEGSTRLVVRHGALSATVTIPLDPDTRCLIRPDGTMTGHLPNGATWTTSPLWSEREEP